MKKPKRINNHRHTHQPGRQHCLKIFRRLSEYLDGELSPNLCREIKHHMKGCINCCSFLNTFKKTVDLCKQTPSRPLPKWAHIQLLQKLRRQIETS